MAHAIIEVTKGDITELDVDAIVNAANTSLLGGGGVDGAIHRAAGPRLLEECRSLHGCRIGEAKLTQGYDLKARYVIHTVGPVWYGGEKHEADLLARAYRNALIVAEGAGLSSLGFPAISTGVYQFPKRQATEIAMTEVKEFLLSAKVVHKVIFCCFDEAMVQLYTEYLD